MTWHLTGIIISWASNALLLVFVLVAYFSSRCRFAPMVKAYAVILLVLSLFYKVVPGFSTWDYYFQLRGAGYILIAGAVINLWRAADYRNAPQKWWYSREGLLADLKANWWAPLLVFAAYFGLPWNDFFGYYSDLYKMFHPFSYYAPRIILFGAIAYKTPAAFRRFDLLYLSFSLMASGMLLSDGLKLFDTFEHIAVIQKTIDPAIALLSNLILVTGLFQVEIFHAWRALKKRKRVSKDVILHDAVAANAATGRSEIVTSNVGVLTITEDGSEFDRLLDIYQVSKLIMQDLTAAHALVRLNGLKAMNIGGVDRWHIEDVKRAAGI